MVPRVTLGLGFTDAVDRNSWNICTVFEEQVRRRTRNLRNEYFPQAPDFHVKSKRKVFDSFILQCQLAARCGLAQWYRIWFVFGEYPVQIPTGRRLLWHVFLYYFQLIHDTAGIRGLKRISSSTSSAVHRAPWNTNKQPSNQPTQIIILHSFLEGKR
jgi:hypothetical protein